MRTALDGLRVDDLPGPGGRLRRHRGGARTGADPRRHTEEVRRARGCRSEEIRTLRDSGGPGPQEVRR